jgi:hypothetical protein
MRMVEVPKANSYKSRRTFRADARAEGDTVEAGGWESTGLDEPKDSRWFKMELTRKNAAWAFHADATKYSLDIILMELALQLQRCNSCLDLAWVRREQNIEADELSNGGTRSFDMKNEIQVKVKDRQFIVPHDLKDEAKTFYGELLKRKEAKTKDLQWGQTAKKRKFEEELKARDPW